MLRILPKSIIFIFHIILFFLLFTSCDHVIAFHEQFSGEYGADSDWILTNSNGVQFTPNSLIFSSDISSKFPYIKTKPDTFKKNEVIEVRFRFLSAGEAYGNGFAITDKSPEYNTNMTFPSSFMEYTLFYIWHDRKQSSYNLHIGTSLCSFTSNDCPNGINFIYSTSDVDFMWHTVKLELDPEGKYLLSLDNSLLFTSKPTTRYGDEIWLGHPSVLSSNSWSTFEIDSIDSYILHTSIAPSPIPSPIPSYSPFPYYSQRDPAWGKQIYDSAVKWAKTGKRGIDRWGCALSSAAMVLKNYDIKSPGGSESTPAVLNTWLKNQKDGYVRGGLLNWIAVTRYAKKSLVRGNAPTSLEFKKELYDVDRTEDILIGGASPILGIPGHFVLAYRSTDDSYTIHDPYDEEKKELPKSSLIITSNTFYPSDTDLSYLLFVSSPSTDIVVRDEKGVALKTIVSDETVSDDIENVTSAIVRTHHTAQPPSGKYLAEITNLGNTQDTIDMYAYGIDGEFHHDSISVQKETKEIRALAYDRENAAKSKLENARRRIWRYLWFWHLWSEVR